MKIYELKPHLMYHENLHTTVEDAQRAASAALAEWHKFVEENEADVLPMVAVDDLTWAMELPTDWPAREGQEVLTAWFDEKNKFEIYERYVEE